MIETPRTFWTFADLHVILIVVIHISMSSPLAHRILPIAYFVDQQIEYVTDNDRDAEALSCRVEGTVIVKRELQRSPGRQKAVGNQTFQTPKRSGRSNVSNISPAPDVSGVSESETFRYISSVPDAPDISNVSTLDL